ncbi:MAG: CBS domain-containing protein [Eggerthellaceae bacterium]
MTASTAAGIACTPEDVNPVLEQLMKRDVYAISETESALDALKLFAEKGISGAPVMSADGKLVGFVSDGDIIGTISHQHPTFTSFYAVAEQGRDEQFDEKLAALQNTVVGELATKNVLSVKIGDDMRDVCTLLTTHHLKKAPVLDQGKMVGMINRSDITRYVVDRFAAAD